MAAEARRTVTDSTRDACEAVGVTAENGTAWAVTDGVVSIRSPEPGDAAVLIAGRDEQFARWLGAGSPEPAPLACIERGGEVIGWVDVDTDRDWLDDGEVNVGYHLFSSETGQGHTTRAVMLLLHHLAVRTDHRTATVLVDPANARSLALAGRCGFERRGLVRDQMLMVRSVPPLRYTDGGRVLRPLSVGDLSRHVDGVDDEQIESLWAPGDGESWRAMTATEQRDHQRRFLGATAAAFGRGPKWAFALDTPDAPYVAFVEADLANDNCPAGDANISYACHPDHRGRGHARAGVELVCDFLGDHTATRRAHLLVDPHNAASLGVAEGVGATEMGSIVDRHGRMLVRHVLDL